MESPVKVRYGRNKFAWNQQQPDIPNKVRGERKSLEE